MAEKNQMLDQMLRAAKLRFAERDPQAIAANAGVQWIDSSFRFQSLGQSVCMRWPELSISPALPAWQLLTLMHYLVIADGAALTDRPMPFSRCRDGMVRGGGFDHSAEKIIEAQIGKLDETTLLDRCKALGGEILPSNADLCVKFYFAPRYPVWLKLWFADDEFPASGRMFVDESADHYLSIEDAVTAGSLILDLLATSNYWQ